jgi:coproporphyrinogen III oxidase
MEVRAEIASWLKGLQDEICGALESEDGIAKFSEDNWTRPEGGGGRSRTIVGGQVLEKGGVMFSEVYGRSPDFLFRETEHSLSSVKRSESRFYATGISIVLHPLNPFVPVIHMNLRYFELDETRWLGGGIDLTPHYIVPEDAGYFHAGLKKVCDRHHPSYYPEFKKWADEYFFLVHRNETRGVGGIFFDRMREDDRGNFSFKVEFLRDVGKCFAPVYLELIRRNRHRSFTENNRKWQSLRRGRYVEFNLVYDKGTKFGLERGGRTESILVSLPPLATWEHNFVPKKNSEEEKTQALLKKGIDWVK